MTTKMALFVYVRQISDRVNFTLPSKQAAVYRIADVQSERSCTKNVYMAILADLK
jgi:hypothetical protein